MITMSWQRILKLVPKEKTMLSYVLVNRKQTEKMLAEVANLTKEPKELRNLLRTIKGNNPSLEEVVQTYSNSPHADLTLDEIKVNVVKLEEAINEMMVGLGDSKFTTVAELKILVDKGIIARNAGDDAQVKEILAEIDKRSAVPDRTISRHRDIRDKLDILRIKVDQPYLSFEGLGAKVSKLGELAELLEGTLEGETILVDYKKESDFINAMKILSSDLPVAGDSTAVIAEKKKIIATKKKIRQFYEDNLRGKKWFLNVAGTKTDLNDKVAAKKVFIASNTKLSLNGLFSESSVLKYIKAVDMTGGSVGKFIPVKFPNGNKVPKVLLLSKASANAMNLNPYAKMLLTNVFSGNWFKKLFENIRMNQMVTEKEAESLILDDILQAIKIPDGKSRQSISDNDIDSIRAGIKNVSTKGDKGLKAEIKVMLDSSSALEERMSRVAQNMRKEQLSYLKDDFTIKEAYSFRSFYNELVDNDPEEMEALKIEYFKNGRPLIINNPKLDKEGNMMMDGEGSIIMQEGEVESPNHASVTLNGESVSPDQAYNEGLKVMSKHGGHDIGTQTNRLRNQLLNMSDFSTYVLDTAKQLKDEGGLTKLISDIVRDASAFEQITAERSLSFLAQMAEHTNNDEVGKAFKTIDSDPESDNAIAVAKQLDDSMPTLLTEMTKQIVGAFKSRLEDFASNPAQFPDKQVMAAKFQFVDKHNLLKEGE